jgi:small-conductance mechanosensitive channel
MRLFAAFVLTLLLAAANVSIVGAITPEEATRVGGDLTALGNKLAKLEEAGAKVLGAAPGAYGELAAALGRIAAAPGKRTFEFHLALLVLSLGFLAGLVYLVRRATKRYRLAFADDVLRARGAAGQLALEAADRIVVAAAAYLLIEFWFDAATQHDLLAIAVLWAGVRWWVAMLLIEALLRTRLPAFRLVAMSDAAARDIKTIVAVTILAGFTGISVMPVLLRAGLPIPVGQVVALVQGLLVAAGCALALWRYRASRSAPPRSARFWFAFGAAAIAGLWLAWNLSVLLLEFSAYHALTWSMRIAALTYVIHALLGLSSHAGWVLLVQRSITAAAVLAIAILLAEVWLVDELALVAPATWSAVRRSLITAALTLFFGYVAWRYLHHWTEERLRASTPGLSPDSDDEGANPASRLTTILPMLRILAGIAILVVVALLALSQLGVEITPLLAGAGVFGLAISFGSQALVRDIVSGIFFMADDAFRVGEYIDTGRLKGTVERISLRSVRLRHQNGQIHTIPFGQLTSITNFSRDWQTVKFNLRLARDTDIEKVRKTVKQLGQEMQKDPELGKELLQPLKLQGVAEIADSALVVRLKFTARPHKPSWVQRESLKRIYKTFGEKGIEFASGAITVQTAGGPPVPAEIAAGAASVGMEKATP